MILKAFIKEVPKSNENLFTVRIPYLEDTTNSEMIFDALLCNEPGIYSGYKVGDCVYVDFEGDKYADPNHPVIIGKLYVDADTNVDTSIVVNNLTVKNKIELPPDTVIGGYSASDFFKFAQVFNGGVVGGSGFDYDIIEEIPT